MFQNYVFFYLGYIMCKNTASFLQFDPETIYLSIKFNIFGFGFDSSQYHFWCPSTTDKQVFLFCSVLFLCLQNLQTRGYFHVTNILVFLHGYQWENSVTPHFMYSVR